MMQFGVFSLFTALIWLAEKQTALGFRLRDGRGRQDGRGSCGQAE
jgi:hypothetical protein